MKIKDSINPEFIKVVNLLTAHPLPIKSSIKLRNLVNVIDKNNTEYHSLRAELIKKYGNKKEDGSLDANEEGNVSFTQENFAAFEAEVRALLEKEYDAGRMDMDDLTDVKISADQLLTIEAILAS